jgi:hypothetical protein
MVLEINKEDPMLVRRFGNVKTKEDGPRFEITFELVGITIVEDPVLQSRMLTLGQRAEQWDPQSYRVAVDYLLAQRPPDPYGWLELWTEGEIDNDYREYLVRDFYASIGGRPDNSHSVFPGSVQMAEQLRAG